MCPCCGSESGSRRVDECSDCGWAQTSPIQDKFDPEFADQMRGFKWCGYDQAQMRSMRDFAISKGWKSAEKKECLHQGFNIVDGMVRLCSLCDKYLGITYPSTPLSKPPLPSRSEEKINRIQANWNPNFKPGLYTELLELVDIARKER